MGRPQLKVKSFEIRKRLVYEAWKRVQANAGAPGVDAVSIEKFQGEETNNLYKLWNRMSAGSYMPAPVRAVEIPKDHGAGIRVLGVPNVADRVAQTAAAMLLEDKVEPIFHPDSYGYRPGRSAHDALAVTRKRCWEKNWVIDLDIRAFFDSVDHDLLLKAVARHTDERWVLLYIERWLKAPMQMPDGTLIAREKGTPQGSPISPLLANLFMHYAFDRWMDREHPGSSFARYADDIVVHCSSENQARNLLGLLAEGSVASALSCILKRRRSCSGRTRSAGGHRSTPASTFSATPSGHVVSMVGTDSSWGSCRPSVNRQERRSAKRSGLGISIVAVAQTSPASPKRSTLKCEAGSIIMESSIAPNWSSLQSASMNTSFGGPCRSSND